MKVSILLLGFFSTVLSFFVSANPNQVIPSKILHDNNKAKEAFTSKGGMEGWSHLTFVIDEQGNTKNVVVFDYSGKERYISKAINYVNNLTYSPASINGIPVVSSKLMFIRHSYSGAGHSEGSVTPGFAKEYQKIMDGIVSGSESDADTKNQIDDLKNDHVKNLNEHALAAWLESVYYYNKQNFLEYLRQSQITLKLNEYLPIKILSKSTVNLFEAQLYFGYYIEAENTLAHMQDIEGLNLSSETKAQFLDQINSKQNSDDPANVKGQLSSLGAWAYYNHMQKFKIDLADGGISQVQLNCLGSSNKYVENWQSTIEVPANSEQCILLIQGQQGTTFEIKEMLE